MRGRNKGEQREGDVGRNEREVSSQEEQGQVRSITRAISREEEALVNLEVEQQTLANQIKVTVGEQSVGERSSARQT